MFALPISMTRFKSIFLIKITQKLSYFCKKCKISSAEDEALPLAGEGFAPRPPKQPPLRIFGYAPVYV